MVWTELEGKQDHFKVWNWNFSLINSLLCDKGEPRMGELTSPWELVQTLIANSIFPDQAEVQPKMESFFFFPPFLPVDSNYSPECLSYSLCIVSEIPGAGRKEGCLAHLGSLSLRKEQASNSNLTKEIFWCKQHSCSKSIRYRKGPAMEIWTWKLHEEHSFFEQKLRRWLTNHPQVTLSTTPWIWTEPSSVQFTIFVFSPHIPWVKQINYYETWLVLLFI